MAARAALLGKAIADGIGRLRAARREDLYLGVIARVETQIGRDFETGRPLGFCALSHAGFSAASPPADLDAARSSLVGAFIDFWARALVQAGAPADKVYSHIALMSAAMYDANRTMNPSAAAGTYLETINFTRPATAFCATCIPGLSTYLQPGHHKEWQAELDKHRDPPWASDEGTAIDPFVAEKGGPGMNMAVYLGNLFNLGAVPVNVYGWGVVEAGNPFRTIAES